MILNAWQPWNEAYLFPTSYNPGNAGRFYQRGEVCRKTFPVNAYNDIPHLAVIGGMPEAITVHRDMIVAPTKKASKTVRNRITLCLGNGVSSTKLSRLDAQGVLAASSGDKSQSP